MYLLSVFTGRQYTAVLLLVGSSLNHHQLHVEDEGGTARDGSLSSGSISKVTGDGQLGSLTLGHLGNSLLPALNHFFLA